MWMFKPKMEVWIKERDPKSAEELVDLAELCRPGLGTEDQPSARTSISAIVVSPLAVKGAVKIILIQFFPKPSTNKKNVLYLDKRLVAIIVMILVMPSISVVYQT